jgi:hypothetical protein
MQATLDIPNAGNFRTLGEEKLAIGGVMPTWQDLTRQ